MWFPFKDEDKKEIYDVPSHGQQQQKEATTSHYFAVLRKFFTLHETGAQDSKMKKILF